MERAKESWVSCRVRDRIQEDLVCLPAERHKKDARKSPMPKKTVYFSELETSEENDGGGVMEIL